MMSPNAASAHSGTSLMLERLCIFTMRGVRVYDEWFHEGLNVIRSTGNTKGKTTICEFIFYLLGGDVTEWSGAAKECGYVMGQFSISGSPLTLRRSRPTDALTHPGIEIFYGPMVAANGRMDGWSIYPWKRSANQESFSQVLFRVLNLPQAKSERETNVTIHDVLRLLYSNQATSPDKIFRDQQFNDAESRKTIGELLLGYDDLGLHDIRQNIRSLESEKAKQESSLSAIKSILDTEYPNITLSDFNKLERECQEEMTGNETRAADLEKSGELRKAQLNALQRAAESSSRSISEEYADVAARANSTRASLRALEEDIQDSQKFLISLARKASALKESQEAIDVFGGIRFERCPSCLAPIVEISEKGASDACYLCRCALSKESLSVRRLRILNEVSNQIRESKKILASKQEALIKKQRDIEASEKRIRDLQSRYNAINRSPGSIDQTLRDLYTRNGYLAKKIEDIREKKAFSKKIDDIHDKIEGIQRELERFRARMVSLTDQRAARRYEVEKLIESLAIAIVRKDVNSDEALSGAVALEFDFAKDRLILDGRLSFRLSATTTVFMKNAFMLALFLASLDDPGIRIPRFMIIDSIEDKGLVPERVFNLHRIIVEELASRPIKGQLIITTSLKSEIVESGSFGVGPVYSPETMALNFSGVSPQSDQKPERKPSTGTEATTDFPTVS